MTVERGHILRRGADGTPDHATNRDRRYLNPAQQSIILIHSGYPLSVECMARTYSRAILPGSAFLEMGICNLCGAITCLRNTAACHPVVERSESRTPRPRRRKEMAEHDLERIAQSSICGTRCTRDSSSDRRIHSPPPPTCIGSFSYFHLAV